VGRGHPHSGHKTPLPHTMLLLHQHITATTALHRCCGVQRSHHRSCCHFRHPRIQSQIRSKQGSKARKKMERRRRKWEFGVWAKRECEQHELGT
jgi:hypothetical protein